MFLSHMRGNSQHEVRHAGGAPIRPLAAKNIPAIAQDRRTRLARMISRQARAGLAGHTQQQQQTISLLFRAGFFDFRIFNAAIAYRRLAASFLVPNGAGPLSTAEIPTSEGANYDFGYMSGALYTCKRHGRRQARKSTRSQSQPCPAREPLDPCSFQIDEAYSKKSPLVNLAFNLFANHEKIRWQYADAREKI